MSTLDKLDDLYRAIGEIILRSSHLDNQLNRLTIESLYLEETTLLEGIVATLDCARKIDILKSWVKKQEKNPLKDRILKYLDGIESVNRSRNICAHSVHYIEDGEFYLKSPQSAKVMKSIDLKTRTYKKFGVVQIRNSVRKAESILKEGDELIQKCKVLSQKIRARHHESNQLG